MKQTRITGRCACGRCSYAIAGTFAPDIATCHCRTCRESTGGTHVTWATVPRAAFRWTGKRPRIFRSSAHGRRYFCPGCGAQLALFTTKSPDTIDVTVATFRDPDRHPPDRHIWTEAKLAWCELGRLPRERRETISASS